MPGILPYNSDCVKCRTLARIARLLDLRRHLEVRPMTREEFERIGEPFFIPAETGSTPEQRYARESLWIRGLRKVARRVLLELLMPRFWKERHLRMRRVVVPPGSWTPHTDKSIAEAARALDGMKGEIVLLEGYYPVLDPIDLSPDVIVTGRGAPVIFGTPRLQGPVFRGLSPGVNVRGVVFEGRGAPGK